jgi:hypothetical protein
MYMLKNQTNVHEPNARRKEGGVHAIKPCQLLTSRTTPESLVVGAHVYEAGTPWMDLNRNADRWWRWFCLWKCGRLAWQKVLPQAWCAWDPALVSCQTKCCGDRGHAGSEVG